MAVEVPCQAEILLLPRWARVALGVRAARRAQALLLRDWPSATPRQIETLDRAIRLAEAVAAEAPAWATDGRVVALHRAARAAQRLADVLARQGSPARLVALAASYCAHAAEHACCDARTKDAGYVATVDVAADAPVQPQRVRQLTGGGHLSVASIMAPPLGGATKPQAASLHRFNSPTP